jgi:hypothetical protein
MMKCYGYLLSLVSLILLCSCTRCPGIQETDFSQDSPQATFQKMKAAVNCDETEWAWSTLSRKTKEQVSYTEFLTGWQLYYGDLKRVAGAVIISSEPYKYPIPAQKVTFQSGEMVEAFLFVREREAWYLEFPSPWGNQLGIQKKS